MGRAGLRPFIIKMGLKWVELSRPGPILLLKIIIILVYQFIIIKLSFIINKLKKY